VAEKELKQICSTEFLTYKGTHTQKENSEKKKKGERNAKTNGGLGVARGDFVPTLVS